MIFTLSADRNSRYSCFERTAVMVQTRKRLHAFTTLHVFPWLAYSQFHVLLIHVESMPLPVASDIPRFSRKTWTTCVGPLWRNGLHRTVVELLIASVTMLMQGH